MRDIKRIHDGVYAGTFDPFTLGHYDILERAVRYFDTVWVCVTNNADKQNTLFTLDERLKLAKMATLDLPNVKVEAYQGLLADYVMSKNAAIVRGVRHGTDYDYEQQLAMINRNIYSDLETLLLPSSLDCQFFSATMVREMIKYNQPLEKYLNSSIVDTVKELLRDKRIKG